MSVNFDELRSLPLEEKLRVIEFLWDDLGEADQPIPLPPWIDQEARRRDEEMQNDPSKGMSHEETWKRIRNRHE